MRQLRAVKLYQIILVSSIAAGCTLNMISQSATQTPPVSTDAPTSTTGATDVTVSPVLESTRQLLATPSLDNTFVDEFFFARGMDPACVLPCWQGLRVGVSGPTDIQHMFDTVFHFDGAVDFFDSGYLATLNEPQFPPPFGDRNLYRTGYQWNLSKQTVEDIDILLTLDKKTDILENVEIGWAPGDKVKVHSVQRVIQLLGKPQKMYVTDPRGGIDKGNTQYMNMLIVYQGGYTFFFDNLYPVTAHDASGSNPAYGEFCLDSSVPIQGNDAISRPFDPDFENLSSIQQTLVDQSKYNAPAPIEEVFDISLNELATRVTQEPDVCIHIR